MKYDDISPAMRGWLGGWEAFRRLGFSADDIFCMVSMSGLTFTMNCFVALKTQGKEFLLEIGPIGTTQEEFYEEYKKVTTRISLGDVSEGDLDRIWQESEAYQRRHDFIQAVLQKGLKIPAYKKCM